MSNLCMVTDCKDNICNRKTNYCNKHQHRYLRHGNPMIARKSVRHGMTGTTEYQAWRAMIDRCNNKTIKNYSNYGARGIKVCDRWLNSFENFLHDMGLRPTGLSLDRIDNNGDYAPSNCRWATRKEQQQNTRKSVTVTINGVTTTLAEHARLAGLPVGTVYTRYNRKWDIDKLLDTVKNNYKNRKRSAYNA